MLRLVRTFVVVAATGLVSGVVVAPAAVAAPDPSTWSTAQLLMPAYRYQSASTQLMGFSTPDNGGVSVWVGADQTMYAASRTTDSSVWSAPTVIGTGVPDTNVPSEAPHGAQAPNGDLTIGWTAANADRQAMSLEFVSRENGMWGHQTTLTSGPSLVDLRFGYGQNGTEAAVWDDTTTVYASVKTQVTQAWSAPVAVSDSTGDNTADPQVRDPQVAVSKTGKVMIAWDVADGDASDGGGRLYRLRASQLFGTTWSTPSWVSDPDLRVDQPGVVALSDDSFLETWIASRNDVGSQLRSSRFDGTSWDTPQIVGSRVSVVQPVVTGSSGTTTAEWIGYDTAARSSVQVATFDSATGWSTATQLAQDPTFVQLVATADGAPTASWMSCDNVTPVYDCHVRTATLSAQTWSAPTIVPNLDPGVWDYQLSSSPSGWLNLVYDNRLSNVSSSQGNTQVKAVALVHPTETWLTPPKIAGTVGVGQKLTVTSGTWNPTPSYQRYQWLRNGSVIPGAYWNYYTPTSADVNARLTVRVTVGRTGYLEGTATTAAVTIPRPALHNLGRPTIAGTALVGSVLTGHVGRWDGYVPSYQFSWLRNGRAIPGATESRYRLTGADRGQLIYVRVTATRPSYVSGVATSVPVRPH